jgi:hypothetical protein
MSWENLSVHKLFSYLDNLVLSNLLKPKIPFTNKVQLDETNDSLMFVTFLVDYLFNIFVTFKSKYRMKDLDYLKNVFKKFLIIFLF